MRGLSLKHAFRNALASLAATFILVMSAMYILTRDSVEIEHRPLLRTKPLTNIGQPRPSSLTLVIYQQYHSTACYHNLYNNSLYRGLNQAAGQRRPNSDDLDAPTMFPLATDPYYQNLLCEFSGMLAVAAHAARLHPQEWIGFQSWRAVDKRRAISQAAEDSILSAIGKRSHGDAIYFWSDGGEDDVRVLDFYEHCDRSHKHCKIAFQRAFGVLFGHRTGETDAPDAPPMPNDGGAWVFMSYFVMRTESFLEYMRFVRDFFIAVDDMWFHTHRDANVCILAQGVSSSPEYESLHCYCYLLERLISIWAYHSGRRMLFVNPITGSISEQHELKERTAWLHYFSKSQFRKHLEKLERRAVAMNDRGLIQKLQTF